MLFAVIVEHGPRWDPSRSLREQALWDEHAAFMDDLVAAGFVVLGGPLGTEAGALLIVDSANAAKIESRLTPDPWIASGHLRIAMIEPWTVLLGDRATLLVTRDAVRD